MAELKFLAFLVCTSAIFFLPNGPAALGIIFVVLACGIVLWRHRRSGAIGRAARRILRTLPFVAFVVLCNGLLDTWLTAAWIGAKLVVVCISSMTYISVTSGSEITRTITNLLRPFRKFGLEPDDVYLLVTICFALLPILRRTLRETRDACRAKGLSWNFRTAKAVLLRISELMLLRVNQLEQALIAKGW